MKKDFRPLLAITARAGSTRLPGKVLRPIYKSTSMLEFLIYRLKRSYITSRLVLTTGTREENDIIEEVGLKCDVPVIRGPEEDVLERVNLCLKSEKDVDIIGRVTADNPLTDPKLIELQLEKMNSLEYDYSYCLECPTGMAADLWTTECFKRMYNLATTSNHKEHINSWIWENHEKNKILWFNPPEEFKGRDMSVTIDTESDYQHVKKIIEKSKDPIALSTPEINRLYT